MENTDELLDVKESQDRIKGEVIRWEDARRFGLAVDGGGTKYICFAADIPADKVGRKYLKQGESISFVPDVTERKGKSPRRALEISFLSRPLYERFPADYHELISIESWHETWGIALRPLGGRLYVPREEIISKGAEDIEPGTVLWTKVAPPKRFSGKASRANDHWTATQIEVCGHDPQGQLVRYPAKTTNQQKSGFLTLATALEKFVEA